MLNPFQASPGTSPAGSSSDFAPSVPQGETPMVGAAAPQITPMRNAAPGLLTQTGAELGQAGADLTKQGNTIGDAIQDTLNDADTKAAENQFLQGALPALANYKTQFGNNAVQQWDPTAQAISKARQDARASLTNPIQQNMFDNATNLRMQNFGAMMNDHRSKQVVQYGMQQAQSRANSQNAMASLDVDGRNRPDSSFATEGAQSDNEVLNYAQLNGAAPDSDYAQQLLQQNRTNRYKSVITSLLDSHAYNEAGDFFAAHKGEMTIQGAESLDNAVKTATHAEQVTEYRNQAVQSVQKTPGAGPLTQPIPAGTITTTPGEDGLDIAAAPGTKVLAPASGKVSKVWTDPQLGLSAQITMPNGYTATMSHLSAVNYTQDQKITQGMALGLSGQDANKQGVLHYAMTDPNGQTVDPRQAVGAPVDPASFSDPTDEEKAVDWINQNVNDPVQQREAESQVRMLASTNRQIVNQQHEAALKTATDYWFNNGQSLTGLPTQTKMQLTGADMLGFSEKAMKTYDLEQHQLGETEVPLLANWIENPQSQTVDAVRQAYAHGQLSNSSYQTALRGAMSIQDGTGATAPAKVLPVTIDNQQIENSLLQNGQTAIVNAQPNTSEQAQKVAIYQNIKDQIDAEQQVQNRPLNRDQKQKVIDSTILNNAFVTAPGPHFWSGTASYAPWNLPPDEAAKATYTTSTGKTVPYQPMPAARRAALTRSLTQRGLPITEKNLYDTWVNSGMVQ